MNTRRNVVPAGTAVGAALPELTNCPDCGAPAEITRRVVLESTDGPVEHVGVRCVQRHIFLMPTFLLDRLPQSQR
jgi:hypothetical protein